MSKMHEIISVKNLSKIYGQEDVETRVYAVDDISFNIERNKITAIIGPSGCGKSTLLHLLGCLDKPTKGKVFFDGVDTSRLNDDKLAKLRNTKIGFVFQFFNLYPILTAVENVELPLMISHTSEKQRRAKALELLKLVGLDARAHHFPNQLSGGEQQRVAIARALANSPALIIADEPTGNLDSKSSHEIMKLLSDLKKESSIIVVTHDMDIAQHADKIIRMKDGKIVPKDHYLSRSYS